jgi:hypothetical protein
MYSKFSYAATSSTLTSGTQTITAAPTLITEQGVYTIDMVACLVDNPSSCALKCSVAVEVVCEVKNVAIKQTNSQPL